jgi:lactoylglutathione lyase
MSDLKENLATGHIGLNVTDLSRSKEFYRDVFGFEVKGESTEEGKQYAFLARDGKLILTLWQQSREKFNRDASGLHHLSFEAPSLDEIKRIEAKLRAAGAKLIYDGIVPHGEGASSGGIFFEDPDGIRLEIYVPAGLENYSAPTAGAPTCGFF